VPWAAGSMYSTTGDLLKWEKALFGGKVLKPASLQQMTTARKSGYALGLSVQDRGGVRVIVHEGGIEGFATYLAHAPERDVTVVVLGNVLSKESGKLGDQLLRLALNVAPAAADPPPKAR
jgi:CubicO group peptidase (beta-lactamase class C family)